MRSYHHEHWNKSPYKVENARDPFTVDQTSERRVEMLDLSRATVEALIDTYKSQVHLLHPFLPIADVERAVDDLLLDGSTSSVTISSQAAKAYTNTGVKRKWDQGHEEGESKFGRGDTTRFAVVYMVLALGELCQRRADVATGNVLNDSPPGFAYFAHAAVILENQVGTISISATHANLLAYLYMALLARPIESYRWLQRGCTICLTLYSRSVACRDIYSADLL